MKREGSLWSEGLRNQRTLTTGIFGIWEFKTISKDSQMVLPSFKLCPTLSSLPSINPWSKILGNKLQMVEPSIRRTKLIWKGKTATVVCDLVLSTVKINIVLITALVTHFLKNNKVPIIWTLHKALLIKSWSSSGEESLVYVNYSRRGWVKCKCHSIICIWNILIVGNGRFSIL